MEKELKKLSPFDFINSINSGAGGANLLQNCTADSSASLPDPASPDRAYVSFMVNRGLSYFSDSAIFANEMNRYHILPAKMQYDFLKNAIRPRKRFSKWLKRADDSNSITHIMAEYNYSSDKARQVVELFSPEHLNKLKQKYDTGGKSKK